MDQNILKNIFNQLPKKYKFFTNKIFINLFFLFFFFLLSISIIFLSLGLVKIGNIVVFIWLGLALVIFDFILFYFFEFLRRRSKNFLASYLNFKNLYEQDLKNKYNINFQVIGNDDQFLNIVVLLLDDKKFHFIGKQGLTYSFNFENINFDFTTFQDIDYRKKINEKNNSKIIFRLNQDIKLNDLIFTKSILNEKLSEELRKEELENGINFYTNNKTYKINNGINQKFYNLIKNFDVEIVVWKQKTYFVYTLKNNTLLTNINNFKFYKNSIKTILKEYDDNLNDINFVFHNLLTFVKQIT